MTKQEIENELAKIDELILVFEAEKVSPEYTRRLYGIKSQLIDELLHNEVENDLQLG